MSPVVSQTETCGAAQTSVNPILIERIIRIGRNVAAATAIGGIEELEIDDFDCRVLLISLLGATGRSPTLTAVYGSRRRDPVVLRVTASWVEVLA